MMSALPVYKKVGLFASIGASILMVLGMYLSGVTSSGTIGRFFANTLSVIAIVLLVAAMLTGGIVDAVGISIKAAGVAWRLTPIVFADLMVSVAVGLFTFIAMLIVPIIPYIVNCRRYVYGE